MGALCRMADLGQAKVGVRSIAGRAGPGPGCTVRTIAWQTRLGEAMACTLPYSGPGRAQAWHTLRRRTGRARQSVFCDTNLFLISLQTLASVNAQSNNVLHIRDKGKMLSYKLWAAFRFRLWGRRWWSGYFCRFYLAVFHTVLITRTTINKYRKIHNLQF